MTPEIPEKFKRMPPEVEQALKELETGERPPPTVKPERPERPRVAIG